MREVIKHTIMLILIVFCSIRVASQEIPIIPESLDFVTDRDLYLSGEDLWFAGKIECNETPSKIIYLDVFNNSSSVVTKQKYWVLNGRFSGYIKLPEYLETGYYQVRIYTNYQKNFPVWQMSSKVLKVVNPTTPLPKETKKEMEPRFVLSPEGNLVFCLNELQPNSIVKLYSGLTLLDSSMVMYPGGLGLVKKNHLNQDSLILKVVTDGQVSSEIKVNSYKSNSEISLQFIDGSLIAKLLTVDINSGNIHIKATNIKNNNLITSKGRLFGNEVNIELGQLQNGLYKIQVYHEDVEIMSFMHLITESTNDESGNMIVHTATIAGSSEKNINILPPYLLRNPLLLSNKSLVAKLNKKALEQAKFIMALQSKDMIEKTREIMADDVFEKESFGPVVSGYVEGGDKVDSVDIYCSFINEASQFYVTKTNETGEFNVNLGYVTKKGDVYLASADNEGEINLRNNFSDVAPVWNPVVYLPDSNDRKLLTRMYVNSQFNSLYSNTILFDSIIDPCYIPLFAGNLVTYRTSDYIQMATTQELINEVVMYLRVKKGAEGYKFIVLDDKTRIQYTDPLIIMDNIYYPQIDEIMKLQPSEITHVDVVSRKYFYGSSVLNGIVRINTTSGIREDRELPGNGVFFKYEPPMGLSEFKVKTGEFGNTLYWNMNNYNPDVEIPAAKKEFWDQRNIIIN